MSKHAKPVIAVGGENLIDSMHSFDSKGVAQVTHKIGGSPYNVAFALARQGQCTHYLTPVSTDEYGQQLAANLEAEGGILAGGRRDEPTTEAVVTLIDGIPEYVFHREGTAERCVTTKSLCASLADDAVHFHAGSLAFAGIEDGAAWEAAFNEAAARGMTTSFDPNIRSALLEDPVQYHARVLRLLKTATIVKLSDEDLKWIYPELSLEEGMETLLSMTGAKLVALTKGPDGAEGWTPSLQCSVENPAIETFVDSVGAGDTFMATLIAGLADADVLNSGALANLTKDALQQLLRRGVQAACLNCAKEGCNPPTAAEINQALAGV
jgi:fructokinase